jgi:hypothetical protein
MSTRFRSHFNNRALLRLINAAPDMTEKIILGVTLLGMLAANLTLLLINLIQAIFYPNDLDLVFLIEDTLLIVFLVLVAWIYRRGRIRLAAYLVLTALTLFSSFMFTPEVLNRAMIVFVFPVMLASFVLEPSHSFLFAGLTTLGYTIYYILNFERITYPYNYFAIFIIYLTAVISWTVAYFLQRANCAVVGSYEKTLEGWARALELRDDETNGHSERVVDLTDKLARRLKLNEEDLVNLRRGVLLHDIGKIGIPDRILLKPGPLDDEEWKLMHRHPELALDLLKQIPYLHGALDIPYCHHEKWDGNGYPRGLRGEEIPVIARLFAVVDVWDALTSNRPYRPAWSAEQAANYLTEQSGKQFDPRIVPTFLALLKEENLI